jgi:hypothetical protein
MNIKQRYHSAVLKCLLPGCSLYNVCNQQFPDTFQWVARASTSTTTAAGEQETDMRLQRGFQCLELAVAVSSTCCEQIDDLLPLIYHIARCCSPSGIAQQCAKALFGAVGPMGEAYLVDDEVHVRSEDSIPIGTIGNVE